MFMYQEYNRYILPEHYNDPYGIHGISHARRVLYLADKIAEKCDLTKEEERILGLACCYHDIGRVHNDRDILHGKLSCKKIEELELLDGFGLEEEEKKLILRLISYHCLNDALFTGTEREKYLFNILKDADGLDRVRIFDLNPAYLRLDASRELVDLAWGLYRFCTGL